MAVEAPYSSFKLKNYIIYIIMLVGFGGWMIYDGYFKESFIQKHTNVNEITGESSPDATLVFHQKGPFMMFALAAGFAFRWFVLKNFKIVADEEKIVFGKRNILIDSIEKIDKTHFATKGHFTIHYKDANEGDCQLRLSDRKYDGLNEMLDHVVKKITS